MQGGCYCGAVRYKVEAEPVRRGQCHCRECQYISGGGPNYFMLIPAEGFAYTEGTPSTFRRDDLEAPVTREFCGTCGTHLLTRSPRTPLLVLKAGGLDDPAAYGAPDMAIFTIDLAPFHHIPDGLPTFERLPY